MAVRTTVGLRRNAAQLHALAGVERELRATDGTGRTKYLKDFTKAFSSYQAVFDHEQLMAEVRRADIILMGDYHALPAAQKFAAGLIEERAGDRPVVLGVEAIFSHHQHVLDEWWRREIDDHELRERIRFTADWGYDWSPFYELLVTAREHGEGVYGVDCMPREDMRRIGTRDRHAAEKLAEIRQRHPHAAIFILFGESHLSPGHLPRWLHERLPGNRVLTVLQNIDALYWQATRERQDRVEAVQVNEDVVCVFNSTPLEKYESYRLYLSRCQGEAGQQDAVPTIYNLVESLSCFLGINRYSSQNSTQPRFLVDLLPEVYCGSSDARLRQLLTRARYDPKKIESMLAKVETRGSVYLPSVNAIYLRQFQMSYTAEEVARFLHHACRGLPLRRHAWFPSTGDARDRFFARTVEHALAYLGSCVMYPARPSEDGAGDEVLSQRLCQKWAEHAVSNDRKKFDDTAQKLGYLVGRELYAAYLRGSVSCTTLRHLFLSRLEGPGEAGRILNEILRRTRGGGKKPCASVRS
ncbi:MAG TPA: ChaN family lipoprotein [Terriglobales bacterium]|nr:ChaN family lipoprotein [Terriglobales bacterium]